MKSEAEDALARLGAGEVRPYSTYDFGRTRKERCRSVVVPDSKAEAMVRRLRDELGPGLGDERHRGVEVVVGPGASQFDILELARSDAANYGMGTRDLVGKLRRYDEDFGIDIARAETDTVVFDLVGWPRDLAAFARDLYEFCPDIVDQGVGSVEALEEGLEVTGRVYLWWD